MKTAAIRLSVAFGIANTGVFAQSMSDPLAQLRACSVMEHAERLACLDKLSRDIEPSPQPAPQGGNWIVSETTSPVDYKQIVAATINQSISSCTVLLTGHPCANCKTTQKKSGFFYQKPSLKYAA